MNVIHTTSPANAPLNIFPLHICQADTHILISLKMLFITSHTVLTLVLKIYVLHLFYLFIFISDSKNYFISLSLIFVKHCTCWFLKELFVCFAIAANVSINSCLQEVVICPLSSATSSEDIGHNGNSVLKSDETGKLDQR